jgi:heptosyltransferase-3
MSTQSMQAHSKQAPSTQASAILVIQLRRLGDVLMVTPLLRALKTAYPLAKIDVLTEPPGHEVLEGNPHVSSIISRQRSSDPRLTLALVRRLRRAQYDLAIDCNGLPSSALLCRASGARLTIGFDQGARGRLYDRRVPLAPDGYSGQHKLSLLGPIGLSSSDCRLDFFVTGNEILWAKNWLQERGMALTDRLVTISPVSRQPYKVWPAERFAKIADHVATTHGCRVLFLYGPGERHFVDRVVQHMTTTPLSYDHPMLTLRQTRAIFEHATLHVGNDNGPAHFAMAAQTPAIIIFGRPMAKNWTHPSQTTTTALEHDPGCKTMCRFPSCQLECLTGTSVDRVIAAVDRALGKEFQSL